METWITWYVFRLPSEINFWFSERFLCRFYFHLIWKANFSAVPGGERWTCLNFCFVGPTRYKQSEGGGDGDDVRKFNARWLHKISGNQKIRKSGHNRWRQSVVGQNKAFLRFCCKHKSQFYGISTQLGQQQQQQQQPKVDRFWYVLLAAELPH